METASTTASTSRMMLVPNVAKKIVRRLDRGDLDIGWFQEKVQYKSRDLSDTDADFVGIEAISSVFI